MIDYMMQVEGRNPAQVVYLSGANRYVCLDGYGNYTFNKKQREFMEAANKIVAKGAYLCGRDITYWLRADDTIRLHNITLANSLAW